jgi:NadR type nicotinamide-nucleotide adenylyltransferase
MKQKINKIVLYGPESTGKTQLAKDLAQVNNTVWVPEYARLYLELKHQHYNPNFNINEVCGEEDILPIVLGQIAIEELQYPFAKNFLFCDTNPLETKVYVKYYFNKEYTWLNELIKNLQYDYYILTDIDIAWQEDPLRDRPYDRKKLFDLFQNELEVNNLPYSVVQGIGDERLKNALNIINSYVSEQK